MPGMIDLDPKRPKGYSNWLGLMMANGTLHVRQYLGPYTFKDSLAFGQYSESPLIEQIIGPISVHSSMDHVAIIQGMATDYGHKKGTGKKSGPFGSSLLASGE